MQLKRALMLGSGLLGKMIAKELLVGGVFGELKVCDQSIDRAGGLASFLSSVSDKPVRCEALDASDTEAVLRLAREADLIINVTHPTGPTVIPAAGAAIAAGIPYLDINIDIASTRAVLELDHQARAAGVTIVPGCGFDPGLLNMLAGSAARSFDSVEEAHFANGGRSAVALQPAAAISHFMKVYRSPMIYHDGKYEEVAPCSSPETILVAGGTLKLEVMAVAHTQLATFPHTFPGVKLVTCKSGMSPPETGNDILRRILEWELDNLELLDVGGTSIRPADFIASFLSSPAHAKAIRPHLERYSAFQVTVKGRRKGKLESKTYTCHDPKALATSRTCALAAEMLARGEIGPGVVTPELIDPGPFIKQALDWGMVIEGLPNTQDGPKGNSGQGKRSRG